MNCEEARILINELSGDELRPPEQRLSEHIDSCASCRRLYGLRVATSEALASSVAGTVAGDKFRQRILSALDGAVEAAPAPTTRFEFSWRNLLRPNPAWAVVAAVLVFVSGYNYLRTMGYFSPTGEVPAAMTHFIKDVGHDAFLQARQPLSYELVTRDPQAVRGWFDGKLDFPVRVPAHLSGDYAISGVRLWHTVSRLSALVSYESPGHEQVSLFVISSTNLANRSDRAVRRGHQTFHVGESFQFNAAAWQDGECAYALVSRLSTDDLLAMAERVSQRTEP